MVSERPGLTVFTPVYNRGDLLRRVYDSLMGQEGSSPTDMEWVVVDDGSTDNTPAVIADIVARHPPGAFDIVTRRQPNGGKHRAVNLGVTLSRAPLFTVLDSDDLLAPRAVATIIRRAAPILEDPIYAGITALKVDFEGHTLGTPVGEECVDTTIDTYRYVMKIDGDRAEVIKTSLMRDFPFPEIPGERFMPEGPVWSLMCGDRLMRFTPDPVMMCEYQPDGLSARYRRLVDESPVGAAIAQAVTLSSPSISFRMRMRALCRWEKRRRRAVQLGHPMHPLTQLPAGMSYWLPLARIIVSAEGRFRGQR